MKTVFAKQILNGKNGWTAVLLLGVIVLSVFSGCAADQNIKQPGVLLNTGSPISSGEFRSLVTSDFNNDGQLDLAGGSSKPGGVSIWYQQDNADFFKPVELPFKAEVRSIAAADLNRNGLQDIICSVRGEA
ncbi:MAG: VCBS repeat-containing protein, partial [Desulfosudaceae bacterium]